MKYRQYIMYIVTSGLQKIVIREVHIRMVNSELLLAISEIMDDKLEPIKTDIQELKEDVQGLKEDVQELKDRVLHVELVQEHEILPRLQNIETCYLDTFKRYQNRADQVETIQKDVDILNKVVAEHSLKLQHIS